ncbi:MAG: metal ABC transporter ATP-binding protein [Candidatus Moraniibacteriota bacterium]
MHKLNSVDHTKNIIEVKNVSFAYGAKEDVLENINLQIHKGDYIGFVGPNGSGKTTLIKIILGLLAPQAGEVSLFGKNSADFDKWSKIGYVPQRIINFEKNFPITVFEVVKMNIQVDKFFWQRDGCDNSQQVLEALRKVGVEDLKNRLIGDLSGGQMQRVFIARALINEPEVIFLDEPTTGIDEESQKSFFQLLQKLNKELGITIVVVSHDIEKLTQEVMHMVCINKTLTCHTTPEEFIRESQTSNMFGQEVKIMTHHKHN